METEQEDKRPRCDDCGSEQGLKKIIYMPNPVNNGHDSVHCPEHFPKAWGSEHAESAEPIKTGKD
jgi:hypothetical protein